ncbi:hypothetical protein TrVE_jg6816 [Triparma verrucosa]|uniref:P-type ATPase A domain-containing protein n=1 Tax=Triparma verrucosa TaxID=1606542 RepID=A0A9W7BFY8_9STRA|nr:hypothetical protein TrVE_jg6816 [Triparma verrucosa]
MVVGDVISLKIPGFENTLKSVDQRCSGDVERVVVPADVVVLRGRVVVNEAMLTGESTAQVKESVEERGGGGRLDVEEDKKIIVWGGSSIVNHKSGGGTSAVPQCSDGGALGYVFKVGFETQQGKLLRNMAYTENEGGTTSTDTLIFILVLLFFAFLAALNVVQQGLLDPDRNRFKLLLHTIIIITSVVPPELPMELSLAVTNSLKSLMDKNVYCTEPFRVPLAGKIDTCCFDKTGTLTSDEMVLKGVVCVDGGRMTALQGNVGEVEEEVLHVLAGCQGLTVINGGKVLGDPLEKATLEGMGWELKGENEVGGSGEGGGKSIRIVHRFGFDSKLKRMSCVIADDKLKLKLVAKGAPEKLKEFFNADTVPEDYDKVSMAHMAKGRRVLALGTKALSQDVTIGKVKTLKRSDLESNLTFCGFIVLTCPLKTDTTPVISELTSSGHRCVMITGDAVLTAAEVARKVGIILVEAENTLELVKDGKEWRAMSSSTPSHTFKHEPDNIQFLPSLVKKGYQLCVSGDALVSLLSSSGSSLLSAPSLKLLKAVVPHVTVFARHAPKQKEAVIAALNAGGKFTMMCGDGTNDVGALKQAHVGISLISVPEVESKTRNAMNAVDLLKRIEKLERKLVKAKAKKDGDKEAEITKQINKLRKKSKKLKAGEGGFREQIKKLKEAEEALDNVHLGDASVASPFTYRGTSISCCKMIALQGRCTLVTMLQIYKILGVNCLVTAITLSRLTIVGVKQGDTQLTALGLIVAGLFFFVSVSKPLQTLSTTRPPSSILCLPALASIITQFCIHLTFMTFTVTASLPFLDPLDASTIPDAAFNPTPLNSAVYLLSVCITVNTFACNYVGTPFTESLRDNKLLSKAILGLFVVMGVCVTETFLPINQLLQLDPFPEWEDRFVNATRAGDMSAEELGEEGELGRVLELVKTLGFKGFLGAVMVADTICVNLIERSIFRKLLGGD